MVDSNLNSIKSDPRLHSKNFRLSDYKTILSGNALKMKKKLIKFNLNLTLIAEKKAQKRETKAIQNLNSVICITITMGILFIISGCIGLFWLEKVMMDDDYVFKSLSTDDKNDMYFQKGLTLMTSS